MAGTWQEFIWQMTAERHRQGITQQEMAERMGCTRSQVSNIERRGSSPTLSTAFRYLNALQRGATISDDLSPVDFTAQFTRPKRRPAQLRPRRYDLIDEEEL